MLRQTVGVDSVISQTYVVRANDGSSAHVTGPIKSIKDSDEITLRGKIKSTRLKQSLFLRHQCPCIHVFSLLCTDTSTSSTSCMAQHCTAMHSDADKTDSLQHYYDHNCAPTA